MQTKRQSQKIAKNASANKSADRERKQKDIGGDPF